MTEDAPQKTETEKHRTVLDEALTAVGVAAMLSLLVLGATTAIHLAFGVDVWPLSSGTHIPAGYTLKETCTEEKTTRHADYVTLKDCITSFNPVHSPWNEAGLCNRLYYDATPECTELLEQTCTEYGHGIYCKCRYDNENLVLWNETLCVKYEAHLIREATA